MSIVPMQSFMLCALESDRDKILKVLQKTGRLHLTAEQQDETSVFSVPSTSQEKVLCEKKVQNMQAALGLLDVYAPAGGGLLASLSGKKDLSFEEWQTRSGREEKALAAAKEMLELQKELTDLSAKCVRAEAGMDALEPWKELPVALNYAGTRTCSVLIGALPGTWTEEQLETELAGAIPGAELHQISVISADPSQTCIMVVSRREETAAVEDVLRSKGFARPLISGDKPPAELLKELAAEKAQAEKAAAQYRELLAGFGEMRADLQFCLDDNILKAERAEARSKALESSHCLILRGYVPKNDGEKIKRRLEADFICQMDLSDPAEEEEVPVLLKNNSFSAPTESVVASYGLPAKGEVDPTAIMSFCYYILFGLMLSDAGYGFVMALGCFIVLKKFPKLGKGIKDLMTMFCYCGISTMFWGVMFGSYFGDAIPVIAKTFFGAPETFTIRPIWLDPLGEPMKLLIYCFLFGIVHLFLGLGIKGYMLLRDRQYMDFFAGVLSWYLLLIGLILMLLPSDLFTSISGSPVVLPGFLTAAAKWMAIVGAAGIIVFSEHSRKNFGLRIAMGAYNLYGATSWLSDVLSYSRLLALGLATGVIAQVFNKMATMAGGGVFGAIIFILVFLVGHTLNLAINLLGAYVHTNRLQFVEFFGKFFDGGGEEFKPLSANNTNYYHMEEN